MVPVIVVCLLLAAALQRIARRVGAWRERRRQARIEATRETLRKGDAAFERSLLRVSGPAQRVFAKHQAALLAEVVLTMGDGEQQWGVRLERNVELMRLLRALRDRFVLESTAIDPAVWLDGSFRVRLHRMPEPVLVLDAGDEDAATLIDRALPPYGNWIVDPLEPSTGWMFDEYQRAFLVGYLEDLGFQRIAILEKPGEDEALAVFELPVQAAAAEYTRG